MWLLIIYIYILLTYIEVNYIVKIINRTELNRYIVTSNYTHITDVI